MASISPSSLTHNITPLASAKPPATPASSARFPSGRRHLLFLLAAAPTLGLKEPAFAENIPLFGLRKKLKKAEEETELLVREGFEAAEKGIVSAEKGIQAAEKGFEAAEKSVVAAEQMIEEEVSFNGLAQAGVVAGAEVVGVLVATSVVNGILKAS